MSLMDASLGRWEVTLIGADDGSGDCFVELPNDLLEQIDWHEGDVINIKIVNDQLVLTKVSG